MAAAIANILNLATVDVIIFHALAYLGQSMTPIKAGQPSEFLMGQGCQSRPDIRSDIGKDRPEQAFKASPIDEREPAYLMNTRQSLAAFEPGDPSLIDA